MNNYHMKKNFYFHMQHQFFVDFVLLVGCSRLFECPWSKTILSIEIHWIPSFAIQPDEELPLPRENNRN